MSEIIGYILITIGIFFDIAGCIGLVRLPDVYNRLQASTKCVTLGTILLLIGVALVSNVAALNAKAIICAVFILITSPTAAHAIAKGAYASGVKLWENSVVDKYGKDIGKKTK
ncbi:MAG: monovalent cation/H(+) antiporter subunit G [Phycisphaerae bacterium]|nr:monovalent cation/H(+) antiporter subunit G [Phycisphaerae bacterium]MDD5381782.1 monovalent cation/H(+) antiporter subunit G [Phycisphaerae bacterium]